MQNIQYYEGEKASSLQRFKVVQSQSSWWRQLSNWKWLCSFLVCFYCGVAQALTCPYTGSECSDSVVGWLLSHQTECGDHETKASVFFASLMAENKGLVLLDHLIFTAGMSDWLDWLYLRHPPSKRLGATPSRDGDVVCLLKWPQSVRNRTC